MNDSPGRARPDGQTCRAVVIEVPDLDPAIGDYRRLLNAEPARREGSVAQFALKRLVLELRQSDIPKAAIIQVILASDGTVDGPAAPFSVFSFEERPVQSDEPDVALDMVCYMAADPAAVRARLALDPLNLEPRKTVRLGSAGPELSFYKLGGTVLELIGNPEVPSDGFWGLSFRVEDIDAWHAYLVRSGVEISEIRVGRKPGTRVATIKSHNLGLPTLLIGPA